jgi:hypothetical protein
VEDENYLVECCIGYQQRAMTKFVRPFYYPKTGLVFCDMAGYKDTDIFTVDIATVVCINDIARVSRSLRFVVLIRRSTLEEDSGCEFCDLMDFLTRLMKNKSVDVMPLMMVMFTHMSDQVNVVRDESQIVERIITLPPLKSAENFVQCSLSGEIELAVSFVMEKWTLPF